MATEPRARPPRLTHATLAVIDQLMESTDDDPVWGLRICQTADLGPGTVYPILERLAEVGWITTWQESEQPSGRPRRRFYALTNMGRAEITSALRERERRKRRWMPGLASPAPTP